VPQVLDDLEHRLDQYEARLREVRRLLAQQKHRRGSTPEETLKIAIQLFQVSSEADTLAEKLSDRLREESEQRSKAIRARQLNAQQNEDLPPRWPDSGTETDTADFGSDKLFGRDDDPAGGNAPVPAFPKRPVPVLSGAAARRFEESDELPRNL
jgi:hypothetical protein